MRLKATGFFGAAAVVHLVLLAACGPRFTREAVIVTDSAGVTIVDSDGEQPAWTRETTWRLSARPAIQVGNQPYDPSQRIYGGEHTRRMPDGGIVVANRGLGDVRIFDAGGYHLQTLRIVIDPEIQEGRPRRVYPISPDSLVIYHGGGELSLWNAQLERVQRVPVQRPEGLEETELEPAGDWFADGTLLFTGRIPLDPSLTGLQRTRMRLLHYDVDGRLIGTIGDFDADTEMVGEDVYVWGPSAHVAVADSTVWYAPGDRWEIREVALDGRTLRIFRLDKPMDVVTNADRSAFRVGAVRQLIQAGEENAEEIVDSTYTHAETFPAWSQILVDEVGNVWARAYRWFDMGADYPWTVFDRDGRYLGEVIVPYPLTVHEIGDDYVLGHMADGRGGEAVYIYRLEKPVAGAATEP
ncbi:MAG: hypothetical protein AB7T31_05910 [Gemmatimonadales bacterium]